MNTRYFKIVLYAVMGSIAALFVTSAFAADSAQHKIVNGVAIYLGVIPAEIILGHPKSHTEAEMHGGMPAGQHQQHVVVALFDNASGKRISDAKVRAWVHEIALAGVRKKLEPMPIAGVVSYGNYFKMPDTGNPYRIQLLIELPGAAGVIETQFEYQHART